MAETVKKRKRSEEDVAELIQRYSVATILSLLQEVSEYTRKHSDCVKIDWNSLVMNTSTGICNAREYQMLWRHLAYHNPLLEKIEDGAEPLVIVAGLDLSSVHVEHEKNLYALYLVIVAGLDLSSVHVEHEKNLYALYLDDDSDLEFELEAVPALNPEELAEVKECAKVILSSGAPRICGSAPRPVAEASQNTDIPNDQTLPDPLEKLASPPRAGNTVVPVSSQKPPLPTGPSAEGSDGNGPGNSGLPAKKKRQLWTKAEDMELIAAVQKCGEGNWANILKGDFKHNRTASQLSQRWALIRKRNGNSNSSNGNKVSSSTRSEERIAANKAFSLAVGISTPGSISAKYSGASQMGNSCTSSAATSQASRACAAQSLNQCQDKGTSSLLIKDRLALKKPAIPGKPLVGPNPLIQAAAFAAGGRIANPSTAASLFKAAQSKNAVHIRHGAGGSLPISSTMANKPSSPSNTSVPQSTPRSQPVRPLSTQPSPASFGTTLSSQRSSQPASLPLASCTTCDLSSQQTSSESKLDAVQGPKSLEIAERKSSFGSDTSDADVQEMLTEEVGGGADEIGSADAATKTGETLNSSSPLNKSQTVAVKEDQLKKEAAPGQALVVDSGGTQVPAKELTVSGTAQDGAAGSQSLGDKQLEGVEAATDGIKDSCPENSTMTDSSKSLGNKQLEVEVAADEVKDS